MDNQKSKWVTPKEIIGISELLTEYAYSKHLKKELHRCGNNFADHALDVLRHSFDYSEWLNTTKLTSELVEKLFKGFRKIETTYYWERTAENIEICFDDLGCVLVSVCRDETIETLADLARLTAAKPILLA